MSKKYKVILISGGFDPVHKGHIQCIQNARELADEVWIGLNNDSWLRRKKGKSFMPCDERIKIIEELKCVDYVVKSIDLDRTVCKTLSILEPKPTYFCNGGDRVAGQVPSVEEDVCKGWGIDLVWGLGDKVQSSSWLLEKYNNLAV